VVYKELIPANPPGTYAFFCWTSAVNLSLTIIANAIRIAGHLLQDRIAMLQIHTP
jgi:heme exporter protein D